MLPTLTEVLAMPSFVAGSPQILHGAADEVLVRWVHSSEVYEMGGLLAGGEVLLTSGLGLEGRSDRQLETYIDRLADAGCAAVAMEVGRSFLDIPAPLLAAARRRDLCLIALRDVVPFERMVEDFHELLVARRAGAARGGDALWQELLGLVVADQPMQTLLSAGARLAGAPLELQDAAGRTLAHSAEANPATGSPFAVDVRSGSQRIGRLLVYGRPSARRTAVADRAAVAVALQLGREGSSARQSPGQAIISGLADGDLTSAGDIRSRCAAAGWPVTHGRRLIVMAIDLDSRSSASAAQTRVREVVQAELGPALVGVRQGMVLALARGWHRPEPARVRSAAQAVLRALSGGAGGETVRSVAVAAPVPDAAGLPAAVHDVVEVARVARRLGTRGRVVTAGDVAAHRFLAERTSAAELAGFVSTVLGPLFEHDGRHATELVRTLDIHLSAGQRKVESAARLGIRRQTLYDRLARIEGLLGLDLADPGAAVTLGLALMAWRLRTGSPAQE